MYLLRNLLSDIRSVLNEARCYRLERRRQIERPEPAPPFRVIVIWGVTVRTYEQPIVGPDQKMVRTSPASQELKHTFTIPVEGDVARFQPLTAFLMTRWLMLGPGRVTNVLIGQNTMNLGGEYATGIVGRYGEGKFPAADVGNYITFQVSP